MLNENTKWQDGKVIFALGKWYVAIRYYRVDVGRNKQIKSAEIANDIIRQLLVSSL